MLTAEAASLRFQHRLFYRELGTLFPNSLPLGAISHVLDLSCGSGTWLLEVVQAYPYIYGIGVDQKSDLIRSACEDAQLTGSESALFQVLDSYEKLPYADDSFDFVHVQYSSVAISPKQWPAMLRELARVLCPGGWIHFLDFEIGPTSSSAINTFIKYIHALPSRQEGVFSPDSQTLTSAIIFPRLLAEAGYHEIKYTLHAIDIGNQAGSPGSDYVQAVLVGDRHIANRLVQTGGVTQHEMNHLIATMRQDAQRLKYCATGMLISVIGVKPEIET